MGRVRSDWLWRRSRWSYFVLLLILRSMLIIIIIIIIIMLLLLLRWKRWWPPQWNTIGIGIGDTVIVIIGVHAIRRRLTVVIAASCCCCCCWIMTILIRSSIRVVIVVVDYHRALAFNRHRGCGLAFLYRLLWWKLDCTVAKSGGSRTKPIFLSLSPFFLRCRLSWSKVAH